MQLIGETIQHVQFGKGVVTACDHNIITIDFPTGVKRFLYPDAFEGYLVPKETETKEEINDILVEQKLREKRRQVENQARQKKLSYLRSLKISANGQAVFDLHNQKENDPFSSGCCRTGTYLSGDSKGMPRVPQQMAFNSLCILTDCQPGQPENTRRIQAVAMVPEGYDGASCTDGVVPFHPVHRLRLQTPIALWPYIKKEPRKSWGHASFRYISNQIGEEILKDIRRQLKDTDQEAEAKEFYHYYCDCNHMTAR